MTGTAVLLPLALQQSGAACLCRVACCEAALQQSLPAHKGMQDLLDEPVVLQRHLVTFSDCPCRSSQTALSICMQPKACPVMLCRHESGDFYALDIGGTNFRVLYTRLAAGHAEIVSHGAGILHPGQLLAQGAAGLPCRQMHLNFKP